MSQENSNKPKGAGSFSIPRTAIKTLIHNKATAWQIGTYLTLARFTGADNKYSTAGLKAIWRATGASNTKGSTAERLVSELYSMRSDEQLHKEINPYLVYKPEQCLNDTSEIISNVDHELCSVKHVLNDFNDETRVWFPNTLIDGFRKFNQPLKKLKKCGDVAARLLLMLYCNNNMEEFGGVPPYGNIYQDYRTWQNKINYGYSFWQAEQIGQRSFVEFILPIIGVSSLPSDEDEKNQVQKPFWDALTSLDNIGFLNEIVTVLDRPAYSPDAQPMYILQTRDRHGNADKSLDLCKSVDQLTEVITDMRAADIRGRFKNKYSVIVNAGFTPHVAGIYRLRFRISNPSNYGVKTAWGRMRSEYNETAEQLKILADHAEVPFDL